MNYYHHKELRSSRPTSLLYKKREAAEVKGPLLVHAHHLAADHPDNPNCPPEGHYSSPGVIVIVFLFAHISLRFIESFYFQYYHSYFFT